MTNLNDYIFIDTETTGLIPGKNKMLELAYAVGEDEPTTLYAHDLDTLIAVLDNPELTDPKALEVNNYLERFMDEEEEDQWADYPAFGSSYGNWAQFYKNLYNHSARRTIVGVNVAFDINFINERNADNYGYLHTHRSLDLASYGAGVLRGSFGDIGNKPYDKAAGLKDLTYELEVVHENAHTAAGDVIATRDIFKALLAFGH